MKIAPKSGRVAIIEEDGPAYKQQMTPEDWERLPAVLWRRNNFGTQSQSAKSLCGADAHISDNSALLVSLIGYRNLRDNLFMLPGNEHDK